MYKIYDDCISKEVVDEIEKVLLKEEFLWRYWGYTVTPTNPDPQMSHILYSYDPLIKSKNNYFKSKFCYVLTYLFDEIEKNTDLKLSERTLYRAKSTIIFPPSKKQEQQSEIHIDCIDIKMDNILYYVNDSDGDTILYENDRKTVIEKISPKAGRFVYFDGDIPHCASRPIESFKRMVININVSKE
tara:strand:+ start:134 stop:691 length:558 start_codon:yes stop_codon:yes gene_type:complete